MLAPLLGVIGREIAQSFGGQLVLFGATAGMGVAAGVMMVVMAFVVGAGGQGVLAAVSASDDSLDRRLPGPSESVL